ncbi:MAG: DNA-binding response regulator, partial [Sphingobacteriales bacterium]
NGRSMDVFLSKIRKYLKDDPAVEIINVHGRGYKLLIN